MKKYFLILCVIFLWTCGGGGGSTGPEEDTTPPTVIIQSPLSGATINETIAIQINAQDNVGISRVEILIDDQIIHTTTLNSFTHNFNTASLSDGSYTLAARAYDTSNNQGLAQPILVVVDNAGSRPTKIWLNVSDQNLWNNSDYRSSLDISYDGESGVFGGQSYIRIDWPQSKDADFQSQRLYKSLSEDMTQKEDVGEIQCETNDTHCVVLLPFTEEAIYYFQLEIEDTTGLTTLSNVARVSTYNTFWFGSNWNDEYDFALEGASSSEYIVYSFDQKKMSEVHVGNNRGVGLTDYDCGPNDNRSDNFDPENSTVQSINIGDIYEVDIVNQRLLAGDNNSNADEDVVKYIDYYGNIIWERTSTVVENGARLIDMGADGTTILLEDYINDSNDRQEYNLVKLDANGNEEWKVANFFGADGSSGGSPYEILLLNDNQSLIIANFWSDETAWNPRMLHLDSQGNIISDTAHITKNNNVYNYVNGIQLDDGNILLAYNEDNNSMQPVPKLELRNGQDLSLISFKEYPAQEVIRNIVNRNDGTFAVLISMNSFTNLSIQILDNNLNLVNQYDNIDGCAGNGSRFNQTGWNYLLPTSDGGFLVSGEDSIMKIDLEGEFHSKAIHPEEYGL
tara:strand:- start:90 stop:1958 length:1869 start_codon:yes stop_codon:yes gene_type:complete